MTVDLDVHLQAIVDGDRRAFGLWLAAAEPNVRLSLRSFASVIDVEAVLQEALLRVWQVAPRFERDGKPNGLLRLGVRIARNFAVSEVRRTKTSVPSDEIEVAIEPITPDPLLRVAIAECRDKLPPKPRQVFDVRLGFASAVDHNSALRAGGGEDEELAESIGMRLNTFLQNFTRARQLLAECLRKRGIHFEVLA